MCSAIRIEVIDHPGMPSPARPASTVVLVRDARTETPRSGVEVLMIHRGATTSFAGMWAFPGGVIEDADIPEGTEPDPLPAARRAAVRETREEVGLDVDESSLVYCSHWLPPATAPKRFSTWFFLAPAHELHADEHVGVDGTEVSAHRWISPAAALDAQASGEIQLAPPTFVTLHDLLGAADTSEALASVGERRFATVIAADAAGVLHCVWEGDAGYDSGDLSREGPRRRLGMVETGGWHYVVTSVDAG